MVSFLSILDLTNLSPVVTDIKIFDLIEALSPKFDSG
jgi:hypothetical protein